MAGFFFFFLDESSPPLRVGLHIYAVMAFFMVLFKVVFVFFVFFFFFLDESSPPLPIYPPYALAYCTYIIVVL